MKYVDDVLKALGRLLNFFSAFLLGKKTQQINNKKDAEKNAKEVKKRDKERNKLKRDNVIERLRNYFRK
jgi:hypothetical protein